MIDQLGSLGVALAAPIVTVIAGVVALRVAAKLGVGPVQTQYVALLRGIVDALTTRNTELEKDNERLEARVGELERVEDELRAELEERDQLIHRLRDAKVDAERQMRTRRRPAR